MVKDQRDTRPVSKKRQTKKGPVGQAYAACDSTGEFEFNDNNNEFEITLDSGASDHITRISKSEFLNEETELSVPKTRISYALRGLDMVDVLYLFTVFTYIRSTCCLILYGIAIVNSHLQWLP